MLSHWSAAEVAGLADAHRAPAQVVHVTVPATRKVRRVPGVIVHRSRDARRLRHPTVLPPQTRVEETVLDLSQLVAGLEDAYAVMARAVNAGLSTPERLLAAMAKRPRMRWRRLLREGLGDVAAGCRSVLELSYLRKVERGHGLPTGDRQVRVTRGRRRNYLDVRYRQYRTSVELDGEAAHPRHERFRDMRRDNARVAEGDAPLRYGMADVEQRPCEVAMQVAQVLRRAGWRGTPRRCPRCPTSPW
jgi:hypothetical protein